MSNLKLFKEMVQKVEPSFIAACDIDTFKRESSFASQLFQKNPDLYEVLATPEGQQSFASCIMNVANFGVSLNPAKALAYIIARADRKGLPKRFTLDISYRGLLYVATRDGVINASFENVVREGDVFIIKGLDQPPIHEYNPFDAARSTKKIVGAYCAVRLPDGSWKTCTMTVAEIEQVRKSSPSGQSEYGPWSKWYDQMCIKTVVKRAAKLWNYGKNDTLSNIIEHVNENNGEGLEIIRNKTAIKADAFINDADYIDHEPSSLAAEFDKEMDSVNV